MRRYIATGSILLALSMACEEKKKSVRLPPRDTSHDVVLSSPIEISLPSVPGDAPEKTVIAPETNKEKIKDVAEPKDKGMSLSAKAMPSVAPSPVKYEDVSSRVLAEGSRNEAKDEGIAKIREKAMARLKEMQAKEEEAADKEDEKANAKVAMLEPEDSETSQETADSEKEKTKDVSGSEAAAAIQAEDAVVMKSGKVDSRTAKNLEIQFHKAQKLAKLGKVEDAKNLFLTICQSGHAHSCHKFAWYEELAGNTANATRFYRAACDTGLGKSCNNLAFQFEQIKNYDKALDLYARGCMEKHEASCKSLRRIREEQAQETLKAR